MVAPTALRQMSRGVRYRSATLFGTLVDDVMRAAGVQGDGLASPQRMTGIYGGYTDLIYAQNSDIDDTTFAGGVGAWAAGGTNTVASSAEQVLFGSRSLKCTYQDATTLAQFNITLTAAAHSWSCWLYIPSDYDGALVTLRFSNYTGAIGTLSVNANMSLTDQWQLVEVPNVTIDAGDLGGSIRVTSGVATAGKFIYLAGPQVTQSSIALPFVTQSATAGRIQIPSTGMSETAGAVFMRARPSYASTADPVTDPGFWFWGDDSSNYIRIIYSNGLNTLYCGRANAGSVDQTSIALTWSADDDLTLGGLWTPAGASVCANGGAWASIAGSGNIPSLSATSADIGQDAGDLANRIMHGNIHWAAFYGPGGALLGDADSAYIDSLGNNIHWRQLPRHRDIVAFWDGVNQRVLYPNGLRRAA